MPVSGLAGKGAREVLVQLIAQQMEEEARDAMLQRSQFEQEMSRERLTLDQQREARAAAMQAAEEQRLQAALGAATEQGEYERRVGDQVSGLKAFPPEVQQQEAEGLLRRVNPIKALERMATPPEAPRGQRMTIRNPQGQMENRMVGPDETVTPWTDPKAPDEPEQEWVVRDGVVTPIRKGTARAGDRPYERSTGAGPTGDTSPADLYAGERGKRTVDLVDQLIPRVSRWTVGIGSMLQEVPESEARAFAADLNALKANIGFAELAEMRNASKTGGALGQVSDNEIRLLTQTLGGLDQAVSPRDFVRQLNEIKVRLERWQELKAQFGGGGATPNPLSGVPPATRTGRIGAPAPSGKRFQILKVEK